MKRRVKVGTADLLLMGAVSGLLAYQRYEIWLSRRRVNREINLLLPGALRD